jgi:glycosyltransferase involved in cell wall biosynthesis
MHATDSSQVVSDNPPSLVPSKAAATAARRADGVRSDERRAFRVLMVVESAAGGTGRHVLDLCEGMIQRGCDVHLVYSTGRIDQAFQQRLAELPDVRHFSLPMRTSIHPSDWVVVRDIRRYLRSAGPFDAIHGHSSKGGAIARLAAAGSGVPAFYTLHGFIMMDPGLARSKRLFYLTIEIVLSWTTRGVIAVSPEEARAAKRLGLGDARVRLVPNGIGPIRLTPREAARREVGVKDDEIVIGFVGRLVEQKAVDVLIRAFAQLVKASDRARLAMVGAGPLDRPLRDLADRLGVAGKIVWLGERDARGVLAAFDVFALSSRKEGLPYVVLEAMAAGLPVVATRSAGVEILIEPGVNGAVVPADDPDALADALAELVNDPANLSRSGRASRRRAARVTIDRMVEGTLGVYARAAGPGSDGVDAGNDYGGPRGQADLDEDELVHTPAR